MYTCASCRAIACNNAEHQQMPKNCPIHNQGIMDKALESYEAVSDFYVTASEMEAVGYGRWPRLREVAELCKQMGYTRIGMAFCKGLKEEAKIIDRILKSHGLEVVSVICKTGGIPKEEAGIAKERKVRPDSFEAMCNPIAQARLLNEQKTQFNVAVGLCVGHDSLFYKHSNALVTTLIAKDRALAHNPVGAVYCADSYCKKSLAP